MLSLYILQLFLCQRGIKCGLSVELLTHLTDDNKRVTQVAIPALEIFYCTYREEERFLGCAGHVAASFGCSTAAQHCWLPEPPTLCTVYCLELDLRIPVAPSQLRNIL